MSAVLQLLSDSSDYSPLWVSVAELKRRLHPNDIVEAKPAPPDRWFLQGAAQGEFAFRPALACLDTRKRPFLVGFTNGRHRTQWLISLKLRVIPICVPHDEHKQWRRLKLAARGPANDLLHLPHAFSSSKRSPDAIRGFRLTSEGSRISSGPHE